MFVLTHLHYLGYSFNPISLYYCYGEDGRVNKVLAEVNNTFGETTLYWLTEENRDPREQLKQFEAAIAEPQAAQIPAHSKAESKGIDKKTAESINQKSPEKPGL